jgi:hypothetical protein
MVIDNGQRTGLASLLRYAHTNDPIEEESKYHLNDIESQLKSFLNNHSKSKEILLGSLQDLSPALRAILVAGIGLTSKKDMRKSFVQLYLLQAG